MFGGGVWAFVKNLAKSFTDDDCTTMAAALSYYTVFSLPPLLLVVVQSAGFLLGTDRVKDRLMTHVDGLVGPAATEQVQVMLDAAAARASGEGLILVVSIITLLVAATGAFVQLQAALNRAWGVRPDPNQSFFQSFAVKRLASIGMVLTIGFLLLVSLALSALLTAAGDLLPVSEGVLHFADVLANLVVFTLLFGLIFRWMPDAQIAWRDVWLGALVTTGLFIGGRYLVGIYLGQSDAGEYFGAAGSLAVIMLWVYVVSMIVLLGAEFTQTWVQRQGRWIRPEPGAVKAAGPAKKLVSQE